MPQRLYVDNGANYRSQHLALVCAKLGVALIHARPYQPQSKGKIEHWFRTARAQLVSRLSAADTATLDALNRRLWAWVDGEYHHSPHRGLEDQTPLDRWAMTADQVRLPGPNLDLDGASAGGTRGGAAVGTGAGPAAAFGPDPGWGLSGSGPRL